MTNNTTVDSCLQLPVPSAAENFRQLNTLSFVFYIISIILTVYMAMLFVMELYFIFKFVSKKSQRSGKFVWMASAQPMTAIAALIAICVPRAMNIAHMFILLYFARCLFMVIELVVDYYGGRVRMADLLRGTRMRLNTLPICCCLIFLPQIKVTIGSIRLMEWFVYQASIIRPVTYVITGIILADYGLLGEAIQTKSPIFIIMDVINVLSTLLAVYGTILFARVSSEPLKRYHASILLRLTQLTLVIYNIQDAIFDLLVRREVIKCGDNLPASVRADTWHFHLLIFECALLATAAAFFLRPSTNATFDLHPVHRTKNFNGSDEGMKKESMVISSGDTPIAML